jgi:hypothetical protein
MELAVPNCENLKISLKFLRAQNFQIEIFYFLMKSETK